jgi:hypothetical protein
MNQCIKNNNAYILYSKHTVHQVYSAGRQVRQEELVEIFIGVSDNTIPNNQTTNQPTKPLHTMQDKKYNLYQEDCINFNKAVAAVVVVAIVCCYCC